MGRTQTDAVKHLVLLRKIRDKPMSPAEHAVLFSLCLYGDENGEGIWPGRATMATQCQITERGLAKIYQKLKEKNFICEDGWHNHRKQWRINTELFLAPAKEEKPKRKKAAAPAETEVAAPAILDADEFIAKRTRYYVEQHLSEASARTKANLDYETELQKELAHVR